MLQLYTREMFIRLHKVFFVALCAGFFGTVCSADDILSILQDSKRLTGAKNGDESAEIFDDVDYLDGLLKSLNWENSSDAQRRKLYKQLQDVVADIKITETAEEQDVLDEKRDAVTDAKEIEQSAANKALGGATIGAMGLGGMELASALSEKQTMDEAEQAMRAYLATFTCRYDNGMSIRGGEINVELPGGNDLLPLVAEYKQLAADLKQRKELLDVAPGIESEIIIDKAETGLYDNDDALQKKDGVYTSLSRAMTDANSADAKEWSAEKESLDKKIKTSTAVVAVTAVASVAANLAMNGSRKKQVASQADKTRKEIRSILDEMIKNCNAAIEASDNADVHLLTGYDDLEDLEGHPICN